MMFPISPCIKAHTQALHPFYELKCNKLLGVLDRGWLNADQLECCLFRGKLAGRWFISTKTPLWDFACTRCVSRVHVRNRLENGLIVNKLCIISTPQATFRNMCSFSVSLFLLPFFVSCGLSTRHVTKWSQFITTLTDYMSLFRCFSPLKFEGLNHLKWTWNIKVK